MNPSQTLLDVLVSLAEARTASSKETAIRETEYATQGLRVLADWLDTGGGTLPVIEQIGCTAYRQRKFRVRVTA